MLTVGNKYPRFSMQGCNDTNDFIQADVLLNEWTVMYFYPKDFTFICPTEIVDMDKLVDYADVIGVSGDNEF
jgi:alkyl hydroperoxide reductase subunit AhpC